MIISRGLIFFFRLKIFCISFLKFFYHYKQRKLSKKTFNTLKLWWYEESHDSQLDLLHKKGLNKILRQALINCRYYSKIGKDNANSEFDLLNHFPIIDKNIIRNNFKEFVASNLKKLKYFDMNTGGSTGEPLEFPVDISASYIDKAHQKFNFYLMGYKKGDIIAGFGGANVDKRLIKHNIYFQPLDNLSYAHYSFSSIYLNEKNISFYIKNLKILKPSILRGYPSFIYQLSDYIIKNDIELNFNVKGVLLTAENFFDYQIDTIKKAFATDIYFQYGHSEIAIFAFSSKNDYRYYCSPFYGFVEVINEYNAQVNIGEEGEVIVTGFNNLAMPFIRYRTGDRAIYGGRNNKCIILNKVLGRNQDYVYDTNITKYALTAVVFGQHFNSFKNIKKWQIIQNVPGEVDIYLIKGENYSENDEQEIFSKFLKNANIKVNFKYIESIELTQRGKHKFLIQNIR